MFGPFARGWLLLGILGPLACTRSGGAGAGYGAPLAADSPWPKFRRDPAQTGLGARLVARPDDVPWRHATLKGVFSSPVMAGDGTVYVGSADQNLYAIDRTGTLRWSFATGEIIDSAPLLDDSGAVYFGSGDGHLYALEAASGAMRWSFQADDPAERHAFIRWFEGNVAIGPNGDLYAPNDNFWMYALDRKTGSMKWRHPSADQTWSLPAVDVATGDLFLGNNSLLPLLGPNVFSLRSGGSERWTASAIGSVVASPLLAGGRAMVGGFDGFLRAYDTATGSVAWSAPARDHLYASPAILPAGAIVQASTDGSVYALDPKTGAVVWTFDTREPIRASPAVDAEGHVYFGSGDGRLYVLEPDGRLRWAMHLIDGDRNDLNASPALGDGRVVLAGEDGSIYSVPFDWCLSTAGRADARCTTDPTGLMPKPGVEIAFVTALGALPPTPPTSIDAVEPLAFTLLVREGGHQSLAVLDASTTSVAVDPPQRVALEISGDRRLMTIVSTAAWRPGPDGTLTLNVHGRYLEGFDRHGLLLRGGAPAGDFVEAFHFAVAGGQDGGPGRPWSVPGALGGPATTLELSRLAAPYPTILPSYNQIGFDSLDWVIGLVEGGPTDAVGWATEAHLVAGTARAAIDPSSQAFFPVAIHRQGAQVILENHGGLSLTVMNAPIAFSDFRLSAHLDANGDAIGAANIVVGTRCAMVPYGDFLRDLGFCNPDTDRLIVFGGGQLSGRDDRSGPGLEPGAVARFSRDAMGVHCRVNGTAIRPSEHAVALLAVDAATGLPAAGVAWSGATQVTTSTAGDGTALGSVSLQTQVLPAQIRAYLMIDAYPAARADL
jgi:outer membrane protein assembly factor BamB